MMVILSVETPHNQHISLISSGDSEGVIAQAQAQATNVSQSLYFLPNKVNKAGKC